MPHYAMSGDRLIAMAAGEIRLDDLGVNMGFPQVAARRSPTSGWSAGLTTRYCQSSWLACLDAFRTACTRTEEVLDWLYCAGGDRLSVCDNVGPLRCRWPTAAECILRTPIKGPERLRQDTNDFSDVYS